MNSKTRILSLIFGSIVLVTAVMIFSPAVEVFAQGSTTEPQSGDAGGFVPCGNKADEPCQIGHLFSAFVVIVNYLIAMAGFVAVVFIVIAGLMMVYSQGQEQLKEAKGRFSGAVIGLVLVALAFILINAIFEGSLTVGVKQGGKILTEPLEYIRNGPGSTPSTNTNTNNNGNVNTNTVSEVEDEFPPFGQSTAPADGASVAGSGPSGDPNIIGFCTADSWFDDFENKLSNLLVKTASACSGGVALDFYTKITNSWNYHYRQDNYSQQYGTCPGNTGGTIAQSGCGVVATAMVLNWLKATGQGNISSQAQSFLNRNPNLLTVESLAAQFTNAGFRVCGDGSKWDAPSKVVPFYFDNYRATYKAYSTGGTTYLNKSSSQIDEIVNETSDVVSSDSGVAIAVVGGQKPWAMKGHFVLAFQNVRQGGKDYFKIADPYKTTDVVLVEKNLFAKVVKGINYFEQN